MDHGQAEDLLSEYLEGGLEAESNRLLEEHLEECDECRRELELLRRSVALVRRLPRIEPPPHFAQRLRRRALRRGLLSRRHRGEMPRWLIPFEASILLLLATVAAVVLVIMLADLPVPITVEAPPCNLLLPAAGDVNSLSEAVWGCEGKVFSAGRPVPPGARLAAAGEISFQLSLSGLECFRKRMESLPLAGAEIDCPPPPAGVKEVTVLVKPAAHKPPAPPVPEAPSSP